MKLQYYVYFLNKIEQQSLFKDERDKNEILKSVLTGKPIHYECRGVEYAFVKVFEKDNYMLARLGKKVFLKKHLSPEEQFKEYDVEDWPHCNVFIHLSGNSKNGQRIAFEYNSNIFQEPLVQLKSFEDEINAKIASSGYIMSISPVTKEHNFWNAVEKNKDNIERLIFSFNSPNLFNLNNTLENELRDIEKKYGSCRTKMEFENPYGKILVPRDDRLIKEGVEYIAKGGGEYKIKIKKGAIKTISNKKNIIIKEFENLEVDIKQETGGQASFLSIFKDIFE